MWSFAGIYVGAALAWLSFNSDGTIGGSAAQAARSA
jgi:hypothetical protein